MALAARAPIASAAADGAAADADADAAAQTEPRTYAGGLAHIRAQLDAVMSGSPTAAVERLLDAVIDGEIDGASYRGHARCPIGWLGVDAGALDERGVPRVPDTVLIEAFAYPVVPGQTPETNGRLRRLERWVALFLARRYDEERAAEEAAEIEASA